MRAIALPLLTLLVTAGAVAAQDTKAPATKASASTPAQDTKAPATRTPATKTPATTTPAASTPAQDTKAAATKAPVTQASATKAPATKAAAPPSARSGLTIAPEVPPRLEIPVIMREAFDYDGGGRRDPHFSLLGTAELRPTVSDLRLVGILYDESGRRPVAIMRDLQTNTQYRVTTGMQLGRLRVALIKRRAVIFSIEEFGLNRQDSLVLGDSSKVRTR